VRELVVGSVVEDTNRLELTARQDKDMVMLAIFGFFIGFHAVKAKLPKMHNPNAVNLHSL
jgi:hypothetical protein